MPAVATPLLGRTISRAAAALLAAAAVLLAVAPATAVAQETCPGAAAAPFAQTLDDAAAAVVCLVNAERAGHGLRPLRRVGDLAEAARRHSRDMVRRAFFSHVIPGGGGLSGRLRGTGYIHGRGAWHVGEVLARGTGARATPDVVVAEWIASPSHHRILLRNEFREIGVGVAKGAPSPTSGGLTGATYTLDTGVRAG
jgi:uncharacterized protein YkwD